MALPRNLGSRTQAENKGHSLPGPIDDSFRNTLGLHGEMQPPSCTANKGPAFSYAVDGDTLFHAGLSHMKPGSLPVRRWTDADLSSLQSGPALTPDLVLHHQQHQLQQHDHAFDAHASGQLLTAATTPAAAGPGPGGGEGGDQFHVDSGVLFQDPKEQLVGPPSSRPTAGNWMERQIYKYNHSQQPSATRRQRRQHKSTDQPATLTARKGDLLFSGHPALSSPPPSSSSSSPSPGTMASSYQDNNNSNNWFQQRLESYGLQQIVQSPECLEPTTTPASYSQTPLDRRESTSHLSTASGGSSQSPLNSSTPMSTPRYGPSIMSHPIHSSPVLATNDISETTPCQPYQDPSTVTSVPDHTSPPPPHQILRSQPCDGSPASSWHSEPMGVSAFQCAQPNLQSHETEHWWTTSSAHTIPNRSLQSPFPHASYSPAMTSASLPFRNQHQRFAHIPESIQSSGLMIGMDTSSPEISSSIQQDPVAMSSPQLSGAEVALPLAFTLPYFPQHHQRSHQHPQPPPIQTAHNNTPVSLSGSASAISAAPRSAPVISRRFPHGSAPQQSPKARYHIPPHQRRAHARKAASFSGQTSKCTKSISSNGSTHSGISSNSSSSSNNNNNSNNNSYNTVINRAVKSVSFVNFTPEDSHKLLTGVAPSGSSKTKARREQEARDKRRKLSEAALLAVRRAGGDVEALEAVLC
ncbi:developmental regulatory protein WetA [Trichophyton verrucosum HKI 0517]|uniref:Developmental regulatory protein wetA n=1 Tax=Trichophyton verrucosum (strain HKI 0517) TaxID=663202 RepID=D4D762_TRIVH|nr:developmental regulatory protein WetA [Trichophyton verrucosum HKI 0517]EFE42336.1 developmental regulatory protein WetA [Trichophyton verrucosum HKI 0517]